MDFETRTKAVAHGETIRKDLGPAWKYRINGWEYVFGERKSYGKVTYSVLWYYGRFTMLQDDSDKKFICQIRIPEVLVVQSKRTRDPCEAVRNADKRFLMLVATL